MPPADEIIRQMLKYLLDPSDADRAFVPFAPTDSVVLLVNNFGGLSGLELEALTNLTLTLLASDWHIVPARVYAGILETSLNGQGFSLTLGNMSGMAARMRVDDADVLALLDAPTNAPAWPKNNYAPPPPSAEMAARREAALAAAADQPHALLRGPATPPSLAPALRAACAAALAAEPDITQFDLQMGDGDCGEAVAALCAAVLATLDADDAAHLPLLALLARIADAVEQVGGSLGAILSILLTAFVNALAAWAESAGAEARVDIDAVAGAAATALEGLKSYTSAREGDRTVMDVLIPFVGCLEKERDLHRAVEVAGKSAEGTRGMKAKFGRATYVDDEGGRGEVPDPGAYAVGVWVKGLGDGWA